MPYEYKDRKKTVPVKSDFDTFEEQLRKNRIQKTSHHVDPDEAQKFQEGFKKAFGFKKNKK